MKLSEIHAREKAGMPENWCIYRWKVMPPQEPLYYEVTGMVAPLKTKGPEKGERNWKKGDKTTERTVILPIDQHKKWILEWEQKTGKCSNCYGTGQEFARWSAAEGTQYRICKSCEGTGKPPTPRSLTEQKKI